jgi:hypothetical protein
VPQRNLVYQPIGPSLFGDESNAFCIENCAVETMPQPGFGAGKVLEISGVNCLYFDMLASEFYRLHIR